MSKGYIDEKIIPMKLETDNSISMSLEDGYYISGKLETFTKALYFNDTASIYTPSSFIDMPDEIKEIKYPTSFRPEIIKTNLAGDVNLSLSLLEEGKDADIETLLSDLRNLLSKAHKGIRFLETKKLNKEGFVKMHCFDFILPGIDEKIYHMMGMGKTDRQIIQVIFNCMEPDANSWKKAVIDIFENIELIRK